MSRLTAKHLTELGDLFLKIAQAVGDYRISNSSAISKTDNVKIRELHRNLLDYSDNFYTNAAKLVLEDVESSMNKLKNITTDITKVYKRLKSIDKAIDIAAAATSLAAAVFSKNITIINNAVNKLADSIKK
jgi:hypothetical protein